jgi:hypothetical protein
VAVDSVDGRKTADHGSVSYPAISIQVGDQFARVWLADESHGDVVSPAILNGDAVALKDGVLVERNWNQAIVHKVTDDELAVGYAVVYVPGMPKPTIVELRFERLPAPTDVVRTGGRRLAALRPPLRQPSATATLRSR